MRMYISVVSSSYKHIAGKLNVENVFELFCHISKDHVNAFHANVTL